VKPALVASLLLAVMICSETMAAQPFISGAIVDRNGNSARITILLACQVQYMGHTPTNRASVFRIQLEPTASCKGAPPSIANTQGYFLPARAAEVELSSIDYDGTTFGNQALTLSFAANVSITMMPPSVSDRITVTVTFDAPVVRRETSQQRVSRRVLPAEPPAPKKEVFVINLESSREPPVTVDNPDLIMDVDQKVYVTTTGQDDAMLYRVRLGFFDSKESAAARLEAIRQKYPAAWIDNASEHEIRLHRRAMAASSGAAVASRDASSAQPRANKRAPVSDEKLASLMADGRAQMIDGQFPKAVQIYTKILQYPEHEHMPNAQEYLALARQRSGQNAHAKAEYQRFLELYPDAEGADRVRQRLAALVATSQTSRVVAAGGADRTSRQATRLADPWRVHTFLSQYYRRDVNQIGENEEVTSQSSLYTDLNFDARRRGSRFDFGARVSAGYRHDMLDESLGPGNLLRISYAFADLVDSRLGLRGRIGRQSRNNGGILGRFDGVDLGYQLTERVSLSATAGQPVNSASDGIGGPRSFKGVSATYGPIADNLDIGGFYIQQSVEGISDREAVGVEVRYFDSGRSFWGLIDYDISYNELGSAFLHGAWRFESQMMINASLDRRRSPFLRTSNALIGQPFESFSNLLDVLGEDELRQLSLDRSAITTTYTLGASYPLSPRFQINGNVTFSSISETPESGGVAATPSSTYSYFGANLVASSLLREGDVSIFGVRYSQSASTKVTSLSIDTRFPITRSLYINPRLRVDYKQILSSSSTEWVYMPGLRMQYRFGRSMRILLDAGRLIANRDSVGANVDRVSYFVNIGYQAFF